MPWGGLTGKVAQFIEKLVLHVQEVVAGFVDRRWWRRRRWGFLLRFSRPPHPLLQADQTHPGSWSGHIRRRIIHIIIPFICNSNKVKRSFLLKKCSLKTYIAIVNVTRVMHRKSNAPASRPKSPGRQSSRL